jgi:hypothetical protein
VLLPLRPKLFDGSIGGCSAGKLGSYRIEWNHFSAVLADSGTPDRT